VERLLDALKGHIYPLIYIALLIWQGQQVTILRERLTTVEIMTYGIHSRVKPEQE
jgi:hypothetical protein